MASTLPRKPRQGSPLAADQAGPNTRSPMASGQPSTEHHLWPQASLGGDIPLEPLKKRAFGSCCERGGGGTSDFRGSVRDAAESRKSRNRPRLAGLLCKAFNCREQSPVNTGCRKKQETTLFLVPFPGDYVLILSQKGVRGWGKLWLSKRVLT